MDRCRFETFRQLDSGVAGGDGSPLVAGAGEISCSIAGSPTSGKEHDLAGDR